MLWASIPTILIKILIAHTGKLTPVSDKNSRNIPYGWILAAVLVVWQLYVAGWDATAQGGTLIHYGARKPNFGFPQAPWRLVASMFLHSGWLHLSVNCLLIAWWGNQLSKLVGGLLFFLSFLATGLWGSLLSDIYGPEALAIGASGGSSGLVTLLLVLSLLCADWEGWGKDGRWEARAWLKVSGGCLLLNVAMALGLTSAGVGVLDDWAHIGGAVSGFVLGLIASRGDGKRHSWHWIGLGVLAGVALLIIWQRGSSPLGG